ncbi:mitochondrial ribosomal protein L44 [Carabus blaptoides fortunei]
MAVCRSGMFILRNAISQSSLIYRADIRHIKRWVSPTLRELKRRRDKLGAEREIARSSFLEWNYNSEIYAFGKRLNEEFDKKVLQQALTDRSYIIQEETRQKECGIEDSKLNMEDNSSLIREGEEFIIACVQQHLKESLPKFPEDGVQAICNHLTTSASLANVALHIGLRDIVLCAEYPVGNATLSNTFKAVVAALAHSSGATRANEFVQDFVVLRQLADQDVNALWHIEKPMEMLSQLLKCTPEPRLCNHSGGNTILAAYQVGLYLDKQCVGLGWGESIDIAIEMAARDGLKRLFGTTDSMPPLCAEQATSSHSVLNMRTEVHN